MIRLVILIVHKVAVVRVIVGQVVEVVKAKADP